MALYKFCIAPYGRNFKGAIVRYNMHGFNQGINLVNDLVNRTRVEPAAASAATAASGVAEKMDTITTSDNLMSPVKRSSRIVL